MNFKRKEKLSGTINPIYKDQKGGRRKQELEKQRVLEAMPTVFDYPDFYMVGSRLLELETLFAADFVVFSTPNSYTVGYLKELFNNGKTYAQEVIAARYGSDPELTAQDLQYLHTFYREAGITG